MKEQNSKKRPSLLASFADESEPFKPWWKDPVKLVDAVLDIDPEIRKALIAGLIDLASINEKFRRQIKDKFDVLGAGKRARLPMEFYEKVMLVSSVEILRKKFKQLEKPCSITNVCDEICHIFERSSKQVETLYYQSKKDPDVIDALNRSLSKESDSI